MAELPRPAREALLATALSGHLSLPRLTAVAPPAAVDNLLTAGMLISADGQVRLSHPLLGVAARLRARPGERQALHLALAGVAGDQTLRARHLALAAPAPDIAVAGSVAAAAAAACCWAPPMTRPSSLSTRCGSRRQRRPSTRTGC